jgi:hypothetical protein
MTRKLLYFMAIGAVAAALHLYGAGVARADVYYSIDATDDPVLMEEIFRGVDHVSMKYGIGAISVTTDWLQPSEMIAGTTYGGDIIVNKHTSTNPLGARLVTQEAIASGFHRGGPLCSTGELIGVHEAAHVLDRRTGLSARSELLTAYGDGEALRGQIGGYAFHDGFNPGEALAEAFQVVECGGTATAVELELHAMLTT